MRRAILMATCAMALAGVSTANETYYLSGAIGRHNSAAGVEFYSLMLSLSHSSSPLASDDVTLSLVSPQGVVFGELSPKSDIARATMSSPPDEFDRMASGAWTIREQFGAESHEYHFTMPVISTIPQWGTPPEILSPVDGSLVPPTFLLQTSSRKDTELHYTPSFPRPRTESLISRGREVGEGVTEISFDQGPDVIGMRLENLRVSANATLPWTSKPTSATGSAEFGEHFFVRDYSPAITLTVVPEPSSALLAMVFGVAFLGVFRMRPRTR